MEEKDKEQLRRDLPHRALQGYLDSFKPEWQRERAEQGLTLGQLFHELAALPAERMVAGLGNPHSYRGYYDDLSFEPDPAPRPAGALAQMIRDECMGQKFVGYKGGDYYMTADTPVWSCPYGTSNQMQIVGLDTDGDPVQLVLKQVEL